MIYEFTDTDYAIIMDSLSIVREQIQAEGRATPNIEAAIEKMGAWARPTGCEFMVLTGDDATVLRETNAAAMRQRSARQVEG